MVNVVTDSLSHAQRPICAPLTKGALQIWCSIRTPHSVQGRHLAEDWIHFLAVPTVYVTPKYS